MRSLTTKSVRLALACCLLSCIASPGFSDEIPKRKPGLWEIQTHREGMPSLGPIQQCIDQHTDNLMQQKSAKQQSDCAVKDIERSSGTVKMRTVCKMEGMTVTSDAVFQGSFESAYTGTIKSQYTPPMNGMSEATLTIEARWLGECKPGQKPGDIVMPKMDMLKDPKNLEKLMNNPQFKKMMEAQEKE